MPPTGAGRGTRRWCGSVARSCRWDTRRLEHAELVSVRIGEDVPGPAVLGDGLAGQQPRPEVEHAPDLGVQVGRAQVQMQPVLLALDVGHPLQQHVYPGAAVRLKAAVR